MKRLSSGTWFLISMMLLALGVFFWLWGDRVQGRRAVPETQPEIVITNGQIHLPRLGSSAFQLQTRIANRTLQSDFTQSTRRSVAMPSVSVDPRFPYRLRNTKKTVGELSRRDTAILLNNALIDSAIGMPLAIPEHLRAGADTESYLLQAKGPFEQVFDEDSLRQLGVSKIAYVPHNTWIVRMSPVMAQQLKRFRGTQAVFPFDPYFKLSDSLLEFAVHQADIPGRVTLQVTLFQEAKESMYRALQDMGTERVGEGRSPFGETVVIKTERRLLSEIASLDGVLSVERMGVRQVANDLTRVRLGIDDSLTNTVSTNFHELTGEGILVNVNDTGVDGTHPDLVGRVDSDERATRQDDDGHGTHVAGTIASSGANSPVVTNVFGSPTNANFHGMAPKSKLYVLPIDLITGPLVSDAFLQERAAEYNYVEQSRTNALLSNNSWTLKNVREYNTSAASYDAAVRDALPEMEGSQPVLYVFAAGNTGSGNEEGRGGEPASISAPGTAKNVITVGALESLRFITNEVVTGYIDEVKTNEMGMVLTNREPITERVFQGPTDSATQIASFSARGNVGIGIEGDFGRFKPDVVAPGAFTISTAATNWTTPSQFLDVSPNTISNQTAIPGELTPYTIFAREGTAEIEINVVPNAASPDSFPRMPIYAQYGTVATTNNLVGFNRVTLDDAEDSPIAIGPGVLFYTIGTPIDEPVSFDIETKIAVETESDDYFEELKTLNESLAPNYRFESGTSMAAPAVTGLLALFQEFLRENDHDPSPALLKALLINGSRTASELYDFQVDPVINFQGWGTVNLANSLPDSMFQSGSDESQATLQFFDQSVEDALATGEQRSWNLTLNTNEARALPLRVSLVWTDPPGNPTAGIKLVNDLDLIVSNTVSGDIFYGNHFRPGELFTTASNTNSVPIHDNVNNVENVFISPPLSTNYVVSVVARRVNVNAVTDHPDGVVQDFALVISSGDNPEVEAPFELEPVEGEEEFEYVEIPALVSITNSIPRLSDRVGANPPLLGTTNGLLPQWQFYVFTNSLPSTNDVGFTNGPNVAFVTFLPPNLGRPRNLEADVDLFVSRDQTLLDLNDNAIRNSFRSTTPGGSEVVILTNQPLGDDVVYYVGVKSEDHQAGQYAFVGISQVDPFDEEDENGNRVLRGTPLNQGIIPDGSPNEPGAALTLVLGNPLNGLTVQSAIAQLSLVHEDIGDLLGNLSHNGVSLVMNNHTLFNPDGTFGDLDITYDDLENVIPSFPTDGPGSLINFIGENGTGVWLMSMVDNALTHTGQVFGFNLILTPNRLLEGEGITGVVQPESFNYYVIEVPTDVSAMDVHLSEFDLPLDLYLRREELPTLNQYDKRALGTNDASNLSLRLTRLDIPPLNPGQYFAGVYNPNPVPVEFHLNYEFERNLIIDAEQPYFAEELDVPITDDAITRSTIFVADTRGVADVKVGLRIDHARASDLTMHLVSPLGTRVLLSENRGGTESTGWGSGPSDLAIFGGFSDDPEDAEEVIKFAPPPYTTNAVINVTPISGFEQERAGRRFEAGRSFRANSESNYWEVLEGTAIIAGGTTARAPEGRNFLNLASARLSTVLPTEPGRKVDLFYSTRSSAGRGAPIGRIFLDGARAQVVDGSFKWRRNTPVRFIPGRDETLLELAIVRGRPAMQIDDIEIRDAAAVKFYQPEEELALFDGQPAVGDWSLEVWDNRAGGADPEATLLNWQLLMSLAQTNYPATTLSNGECVTNTVVGDDIQYYIVDVPRIATIATNWLSGTGDLMLLWNEDGIPTGESPPDIFPPIDFNGEGGGEGMTLSTSGISIFDTETNRLARFPTPRLQPGQRYYLGVKNADPDTENEYEICVRFDQDDVQITTLTNNIAFTNTVSFTEELEFQYYRYRAGSNVLSMDIEIVPADGDVNAVERFGLPLPTLTRFDHRAEEVGLDPELITISNRPPATIVPGDYYIGVYNVEPNRTDAIYSILVTEETAPYQIIRLPNGEPIDFTLGQNIDEAGTEMIKNYFMISITNPAISQARIDLWNLSGNARALIRRDELPTVEDNDQLTFANPELPGSGRIVMRTNELRPSLVGDWFFALLNEAPEPLEFTVSGTTYTNTVPIIDLQTSTWITNTVVASKNGQAREADYYRFFVSDKALDVNFTVVPMVGGLSTDVDLFVRKDRIPTELEFDYEKSTRGPDREAVGMGPALDGPLVPGEWLLAVINEEDQPVTYRIQVIQNLDLRLPELEDNLWVTNSVAPPPPGQPAIPDYYSYNIRTSATSATFELEPLVDTDPGNLDLVIRHRDLPDLITFDAASSNTGITPESIVIDQETLPRIDSGRWFVGVINREGVNIPYRIRANQVEPIVEPPVGPIVKVIEPDVTLIGSDICIAWDTVPGTEYYIQGKEFQSDEEWVELRGPVVTPFERRTECFPNTIPYQFFRVIYYEGEAPPQEGEFLDTELVLSPETICVTWSAIPETTYTVQAKRSVDDLEWQTLAVLLADQTLMEHCVGRPTDFRLFRVGVGVIGVPPVEVIDPELVVVDDVICLRWPAEAGQNYTIEGKLGLTDGSWTSIDVVRAEGGEGQYCLTLPTDFRFFRIRPGGVVPSVPEFIDPVLEVGLNEICLTWISELGRSYVIQGRGQLSDTKWDDITTVVAQGVSERFCVGLPTPYRFFRVSVGDRVPPREIRFIDPMLDVGATDLCLSWVAEPSRRYTIQGRGQLADSGWVDVTTVVAQGISERICVELPTSYRFFRVAVGEMAEPKQPVFIEPIVSIVDNELCVVWDSVAGFRYGVEGKQTLGEANWRELVEVVAEGVSGRYCLELPTDMRFFRIRVLGETHAQPEPPPAAQYVEPGIAVDAEQICLDWTSVEGTLYRLQGKRSVTETEWTEWATVVADGPTARQCLSRPTEFRFFRVVVGGRQPVEPDPMPQTIIDPGIGFNETQVCLSWESRPGGRYAIEGRSEIIEAGWRRVAEVTAAETKASFCLDLTTEFRFFRIVELGAVAPPVAPPASTTGFIDPFIRLTGDELCIDWPSQVGVDYVVQRKANIDTVEWTTVEQVESSGDLSSICLPGTDAVGFFRVAILEGQAPIEPDPVPSAPLAFDSIVRSDSGVRMTWQADADDVFVMDVSDVIPPEWRTSEPITSSNGEFSFSDSVGTENGASSHRFYRLRRFE